MRCKLGPFLVLALAAVAATVVPAAAQTAVGTTTATATSGSVSTGPTSVPDRSRGSGAAAVGISTFAASSEIDTDVDTGAYWKLSRGNRRVAMALYRSQNLSGSGATLTLDQIATMRESGEGWGAILHRMRANGDTSVKSVGQALRRFRDSRSARFDRAYDDRPEHLLTHEDRGFDERAGRAHSRTTANAARPSSATATASTGFTTALGGTAVGSAGASTSGSVSHPLRNGIHFAGHGRVLP